MIFGVIRVNIASRMESMSEVGRVNISEQTYNLIKSEFECEYRGEFDVKNRGKMKMYFVNPVLAKP
jgi:adenylate cyclase